MARIERVLEKIDKMGMKQNIAALSKMMTDPDDEIREAVAKAFGQINTYESGTQLNSLLRDDVSAVKLAAIYSIGKINAKQCEEYIKKLAYSDHDPDVRSAALEVFNVIRTPVL